MSNEKYDKNICAIKLLFFYSSVWSELDFAAQAVSFHADGYNTVVTALSFALHELALQPQIQDRLAQEIKFHHERNRGNVTFQSIKNMKYMDMVVSGKREMINF